MNPNTATGYEDTGINPNWKPSTASDFLETADRTLGERGKQYDPAAKQERSMTAIVQAFNAIYPVHLTVHMGWQFMALVKMVRGATNPHADSALDQVAYAALAAEEVATRLHSQEQLREAYAHSPYAGKAAVEVDVKPEPTAAKRVEQLLGANHVLAEELGKCQHWAGVQSQELKHLEAKAMAAHEAYMQALEHNRSLEVQLDATHSALSDFVCRFDLTKEYMTKEQVLAGQAKHKEQVASLSHTVRAQAEAISELRDEVAIRQNALVAQQEQAEYRDKRNAELCAQLESARNSLRLSEQSADEKIQSLSNELTAKIRELVHMHTRRAEAPVAHNTDEAVDGKCNNLLHRGGLVQPTSSGSMCDASIASQLS